MGEDDFRTNADGTPAEDLPTKDQLAGESLTERIDEREAAVEAEASTGAGVDEPDLPPASSM